MTTGAHGAGAADPDALAYRLAAGTALLSVGKRPVLHSGSGETLYALNPVASLLAGLLESGAGFAELVEVLALGGMRRTLAARQILMAQLARAAGRATGAAPAIRTARQLSGRG